MVPGSSSKPVAPEAKTICFDLDGTLCSNTFGDYESAEPFPWAIARVNALAEAGHRIVIFTARGTATGIDWSEVTAAQLERWGVRHDEMRFGKPSADVYVDDRAIHTDSWRVSGTGTVPGFALPGPAEAEQVPLVAPPAVSAVVELGRTFAGRPLWLAEHSERAVARARAAGIRFAPTSDQVAQAALDALAVAGAGEVTYAISLWDAASAAALDVELRPQTGLHVSCRPLEQSSAGLTPLMLASADGIPVVRASLVGTGGWPLELDAAGNVGDARGGRLVIAAGDDVAVEPARGGELPSIARLLETLDPDERPIQAAELAGADELLVAGLPFGVVAIGALDGEPAGDVPGPVARRLAERWDQAVGLDLAAQPGGAGGG